MSHDISIYIYIICLSGTNMIICGRPNTRLNNLIKAGTHNIIHLTWIIDCIFPPKTSKVSKTTSKSLKLSNSLSTEEGESEGSENNEPRLFPPTPKYTVE